MSTAGVCLGRPEAQCETISAKLYAAFEISLTEISDETQSKSNDSSGLVRDCRVDEGECGAQYESRRRVALEAGPQ